MVDVYKFKQSHFIKSPLGRYWNLPGLTTIINDTLLNYLVTSTLCYWIRGGQVLDLRIWGSDPDLNLDLLAARFRWILEMDLAEEKLIPGDTDPVEEERINPADVIHMNLLVNLAAL